MIHTAIKHPREFWIKKAPKYDPSNNSVYETEVALHEPDTNNVMWSDFREATHVIEYSAYGQAKAATLRLEHALQDAVKELEMQFKTNRVVREECERLKAIVNKFKVHGTDGCRKCETGRVTMFIANENCTECDPQSYEVSR